MSWNYRVVKTEDEHGTYYAMHEVCYLEDGRAWGMTESAVKLSGFGSIEELRQALTMMLVDIDRHPVFEEPEEWPEAPFAGELQKLADDIANANKGDERVSE